MSKDLGVLPEIANLGEVGAAVQEIDAALKNLDTWMKPEAKSIPLLFKPASGKDFNIHFGFDN